MNSSLIRKFCESRYRWPIVATATLLVGLVTLLPLADVYSEKREACNVLKDKLDSARQTAKTLPKFEERVEKVAQELEALEARGVGEERIGDLRNRIIKLARDNNCQVRKIEMGSPLRRIWLKDADVLETQAVSKSAKGKTPFELVRRTMVLAVDGNMADLELLLEKIQEEKTLAHPQRLSLNHTGRGAKTVGMEIELLLFDLTRKRKT
ncbi:MAG: hypothetical protein RH917_14705 [Lacipirellulaceae bacterium]